MLIPTKNVRAGDCLGTDAFHPSGLLVLSAGTLLSAADIEKLQRLGIDKVDIVPPDGVASPPATATAAEAYSFSSEPKEAAREKAVIAAYQEAVDGIKITFEQALEEGFISPEQVARGFNPLAGRVHEEKDVVSLLLVLNNRDDYTYQHSVQVGMISYYIAKWMGQTEEKALLAGRAGYLHDIGKCRIDRAILQKPSRLTAEEYDEIKKHTVFGYDILKRSGFPEEITMAALQHHERFDGSGYPLKLRREAIHPMAKIVAVADIYSAMISTRVYQKKRDLLYVLRELYRCSFGELDPEITQVFIRHMIPNFINKKIQLLTGEIGTIVMTNPSDFFRPLVNFDGEFVDLSERRDLEVEHIFV
ncbi:metal dependent phosphohydrolase [Paenibacillus mucilaginosus 3016]|uniref:Metal dependent phosphohydrolase n=1 Tax=Paenibacillus mucilaginosus 3016 TaxID=1116391 RepID=H6N9U0_9BACL|nr:HD-GYP domain-containing protein [Paenibacillus mucilaginosus]AFC28468.1 metal dependent phosphohydrolase [Paenibacillus mucilaginosus 3016]WFA22502.1 HD-GYP domain-containing protein [Paenibacillus mucilaginosus]